MMATALVYLLIQVPAFFYMQDADHGAAHESKFALFGFVIAFLAFLGYVYWIYTDGDAIETVREKQRRLEENWTTVDAFSNLTHILGGADPFTDAERLFSLFDHDQNGEIDFAEMRRGWESIGYAFDDAQARASFNMVDHDGTGSINRAEFVNWIEDYLLPQYLSAQPAPAADAAAATHRVPAALAADTRRQIEAFLADPAQTTITLTLTQASRYLLHAWAAAYAPTAAFALSTHAHDASAEAIAAATFSSPSVTAAAVAAAAAGDSVSSGVAGHTRHLDVTKVDPASSAAASATKPQRQALHPGVPAWACASPKLTQYFNHNHTASLDQLQVSYAVLAQQDAAVFDKLFATALGAGSKYVFCFGSLHWKIFTKELFLMYI